MTEVEQIVEEILIENNIDFDHPVVPFLFEDVEQALNELDKKTLKSYDKKATKSFHTAGKKFNKDGNWNDGTTDTIGKRAAGRGMLGRKGVKKYAFDARYPRSSNY